MRNSENTLKCSPAIFLLYKSDKVNQVTLKVEVSLISVFIKNYCEEALKATIGYCMVLIIYVLIHPTLMSQFL